MHEPIDDAPHHIIMSAALKRVHTRFDDDDGEPVVASSPPPPINIAKESYFAKPRDVHAAKKRKVRQGL